MKNYIRKKLRENLNEVNPVEKEKFGYGFYHNVYSSKRDPNILYKVGDEDVVEEWVHTFKQNPNVFPKIYKVFSYQKNPELMVVAIERLDTEKASKELKIIDDFLINVSDIVYCKNQFVTILTFFEEDCFDEVILAAKKTSREDLIPMLIKWAKFLRVVSPIVENDLGRPLDLHFGNVAYDKQGNLKMIDI